MDSGQLEMENGSPNSFFLLPSSFLLLPSSLLPAVAAATATELSAAAALARGPLLPRPPNGERGKGEDEREDDGGTRVHARTSFGAGRKIAQRTNASTASVTAVQRPKPPPQARMPIW